jgi:tetratricopeptide (TPR) repeat protein
MRTSSRTLFSAIVVFLAIGAFAQAPDVQLRYKVEYKCGGERIEVVYCRKDSDMPGYPPTPPQKDYCLVYYPDRPMRGGFAVQTSELRSEIVKKLQACGALAQEKPMNPQPDSYLIQANKYLAEKQYTNAITAYKQAIVVQPSSGAYVSMGYAYYQLEQYQNALEPFEQAARLKPDDFSNYYWVGVTQLQLKQYPAALAALQESIRLNPKESLSYHWLGEVYLIGYKQYDKAVAAYLECRRLDPSDARNHNELGVAYDDLKQYASALAEFQEAVRLKPDEPLYQSNLGSAYLKLHRIDDAEKVSERLGKLDEKMGEALDKQILAVMYDMQHSSDQKSAGGVPAAK